MNKKKPAAAAPETDGVILTAKEVCLRWKGRVTPGTLANWRHLKRGPNYFKLGGVVLYSLSEIQAFEKRNVHRIG